MARLRFHRLQVLRRLPHPGRGFTQGLIVNGRAVWESTGGYEQSSLRRYELGALQLDVQAPLAPELFGEGICLAGTHIWQLTWQERIALRWNACTMQLTGTVPFDRHGWGICAGPGLILTSDGSSELVLREPGTLEPYGHFQVRLDGKPLPGLNDLEWRDDKVWANLMGTRYLAGIDPGSGDVTDLVDAGAVMERHRGDRDAVLNGIASLPGAGEFLLTGKNWRSMYHVRLTEERLLRWPGQASMSGIMGHDGLVNDDEAIGWIREIVLNCADPWALAQFWAGLLGGTPVEWYPGWVTIEPPPHGQRLSFQASDAPPAGTPLVHFDVLVEDLAAAHDRVLAAGATFAGEHVSPRPGPRGESIPWRVYQDPAGHPFCLVVR